MIVNFEQYAFKGYVEYSLQDKETIVRGYRFLETDTLIGVIQFNELEVYNIAILNAQKVTKHKIEKDERIFMNKLLRKKNITGVAVPDEIVSAKNFLDVLNYCASQKIFAVLEGINDDDFDIVEFKKDNQRLICREIYPNGETSDEWFEFDATSQIVSATVFDTYAGNLQFYVSSQIPQKLEIIST